MGIRPQILFGCAIQVTPGPHYKVAGWPEDWIEKALVLPETADLGIDLSPHDTAFLRWSAVQELRAEVLRGKEHLWQFVEYDAEYGRPDLVFFPVDESGYDDEYVRALAHICAKMHTEFVEMPLLPPEQNRAEPAMWWRLAQDGRPLPERVRGTIAAYQRTLDNRHNYTEFSDYMPVYVARVNVLLEAIGVPTVEPAAVRLGILWKWS